MAGQSLKIKLSLSDQEIVDLYKNDISIKEIAEKCGVSIHPIVLILKKYGIRKPNWAKMLSYPTYELLRDKEQFQKLVDEHISIRAIAAFVGCGVDMITTRFKAFAIPTNNSGMSRSLINQKTRSNIKFNKENVNHHYSIEKITIEELVILFGVSPGYLRKKIREWGIPLRNFREVRVPEKAYKILNNKEKMQELYPKYSIIELVDIIGCGRDMISEYIKFHNIPMQTPSEFKKRHYLKKFISRFSVNGYNLLEDDIYIENRATVLHQKCNKTFVLAKQTLNRYAKIGDVERICPYCYPRNKDSKAEREMVMFLRQHYDGDIEIGNRQILRPKEIDIYIPDKNVAIEICGLYWHADGIGRQGDPKYHLKKTKACQEKNIRLITIFEDEWKFKRDIVKSRLLSILKLNKIPKVNARDCIISEISPTIKNEFLEKYHIQGGDVSSIKLGLFFENQLVAVMTFSKLSISKGGKHKINNWELNRFATHSDYNVRGAAGKLLSYFKTHYDWESIISYADRRWSNGDLYHTLGFALVSTSSPNYWYVPKSSMQMRLHRFGFRKSELVKQGFDPNKTEFEIMAERKYLRVWDCGTLKFELKNEEIQ